MNTFVNVKYISHVAALRTPILLSDSKGFNLKTHLMVKPERFIEFVSELFLSLYLSKRLIYSFVANEFAPLFWGKVHVLCSPLRFSRVCFFFTPIYFVRGSNFIHDICIYQRILIN